MSFTEIYEIDMEILSRMELDTLIYTSMVNKYFDTMYEDDNLWRMRLLYEFGNLTPYKPTDTSFYDQYCDLLEWNADEAAINGRVDVLIVNAQRNEWPDQEAIDQAATQGHLVALRWLKDHNLIPSEHGLDNVTSKGYLNVLQLYPEMMNVEYANFAASFGYLHILKWLATINILPSTSGLNSAAAGGYLDILEWATSYNLYANSTGADEAAMYGHYDTLKWLFGHKIYPTQRGVNKSTTIRNLNILLLLASYKLYPTQEGAKYAFVRENYEIADWLAKRNILPDAEEATKQAIQMQNIQMAQWLDQHNLFKPTDEDVTFLLDTSKDEDYSLEESAKFLELAQWIAKCMYKHGQILDTYYFMEMIYPDFVDWYYKWRREGADMSEFSCH